MASKIDVYKDMKRAASQCREWASLIGSRYNGGGGGIGRLHSFRIAMGDAAPTVYHQYSDGATNYHGMPSELQRHLEDAIKARFVELLSDALERQEKELKAAADAAVKEHGELLKAAGLEPA